MLLTPTRYIGEIVRGDPIFLVFNSFDANLTPASNLTGPGGIGDASIRLRDLTTNTVTTSGITFTPGAAVGTHLIEIASSGLEKTRDYAIEISSGEVAGTDVSNTVLAEFASSGKAAGRVYEQAVKCDAGTVTASAGQFREFTITGDDIEDETDNYYASQVLKFSPGAANKNIGRTILKSVPGGAGSTQCTVTVQNGFPRALIDGDPFVILPEERELSIYTCNITVEFGISTGQGDKFSIEWFVDGHPMANANTVLTQMGLEVVRWSDDAQIVTEQWPGNVAWAPNANLFKYTGPAGDAILASDGVTIRAIGLIDDIPEAFSRTLFNYA